MKLIFCPKCQDVVKLRATPEISECQCGESWGYYHEDGYNATINDVAIPIGFANSTLAAAIKKQPESGWGERFEAFVIPKQCQSITVKKGQ